MMGMGLLLRELEDGNLKFRRMLGNSLNFTSQILTIAGLTEPRIPIVIIALLGNSINDPIVIHIGISLCGQRLKHR